MNSHNWNKQASHLELIVKAKSEQGLFEESLHGIYNKINPVRAENVAPIVNLDLKGQDMGHLLKEFVSSVITWSMLHKAHYHSLIIHEISHNHLIGILEGHAADSFENKISLADSKNIHINHKDGWFHACIAFNS